MIKCILTKDLCQNESEEWGLTDSGQPTYWISSITHSTKNTPSGAQGK